jgi:2-polyprenyl-3-methyl-5-hydroxy-6-metoxy-1,4-benzoquinol methylase
LALISSEYLSRARLRPVLPMLRGRILDVGCGRGALIDQLPPSAVYVGADINPDFIRELESCYPRYRFYHINLDEGVQLPEEPFDVIVSLAVIEHLRRPEELLKECLKLLDKEGLLILTTPTCLGDIVHRSLEKVGLAHPGVSLDHLHVFSLKSLEGLVRSCGYQVVQHRAFQGGLNQILAARPA